MISAELLDYLFRESGILVGSAIGAAIVFAITRGYQRYKQYVYNKRNSISELINTDITVYRYLAELMYTLGADRVFVMQFHNGVYYVNNASQMKMSCTHEVTREGISRERRSMQDMLLSRFPVILNDLQNGALKLYASKMKGNDSYFFQMLREQGVQKCIANVMKEGTKLEGFVGVSFLNESSVDNNEEYTMKLIDEITDKIGFVLRTKK